MAIVGVTLLLVVYLADWSQLKLALRQLGSRPWLVGIFVLAYTGAFLLSLSQKVIVVSLIRPEVQVKRKGRIDN